jgi:hypothetical protein
MNLLAWHSVFKYQSSKLDKVELSTGQKWKKAFSGVIFK